MRLRERPPGWSPLETAGHLHLFYLLCCLPVVCVCVLGGGGGWGIQLVQSLQIKPQDITCSFSGNLCNSKGSKHFFLIYSKCHLQVIALGTPGYLCICDLPVLSPGLGGGGGSWFRVFR